jgi:hypothetical protein
VYAGHAGFWNALYSTMWLDGFLSGKISIEHLPPWNHAWMLAGAWLAVVPTLTILGGAVAAFLPSQRRRRPALLFAASCVAIYLLAMLYLYIQVPTYSMAKASYTLALLPCYALLGAAGSEMLLRSRLSRAFVVAWMSCWAVFAWGAYLMT